MSTVENKFNVLPLIKEFVGETYVQNRNGSGRGSSVQTNYIILLQNISRV